MIYYNNNLTEDEIMELIFKYERELNVPMHFTLLYLKLEEIEYENNYYEEDYSDNKEIDRLNEIIDENNIKEAKIEFQLISKIQDNNYYKNENNYKSEIINELNKKIYDLYEKNNTNDSNKKCHEESLECNYNIID